ncbi:tetratricopeptide repeat protein [Spirosoma areae]
MIDSLLTVLPQQTDTAKTLTYAKLCWEIAKTDQSRARQYGQVGLALAHKLNYGRGEVENLQKIGVSYGRQANYPEALTYFLRALPIAEKLPNKPRLAHLLENIGMVYTTQKEFAKSLAFYDRALALYQQQADKLGAANTYYCLGEVYTYLKQFKRGMNSFEKSLSLYDPTLQRFDYGASLSGIAWALHRQHRFAEAIPYDLQCLELMEAENFQTGIANAADRLAISYSQQGDHQRAEQYGLRSLAACRAVHDWNQTKNTEKTLFRIYTASGNLIKANQHFSAFEAAQDSVFGQQRSQAIAEVETRYQTKLKDQQIAGLNQKTQLQQYLLWAGVLGGILLLLVLGLLYNRYQLRDKEKRAIEQQHGAERELSQAQQEKLQLELDLKHRELASNALFAYQKNEMLGDLKEQVDELLLEPDKPQKQKLKAIQKFIQSNLHFEADWDGFKLHFEQVHPRFFEKLQTNFPDLTPNELKLCAYTRINLSNKEIARLLNINSSSVEMARYRMKKKVGLEGQATINDFIQTI